MTTNLKVKKSIFKRYRLLPLIMVGAAALCLLILLALLIWGSIVYAAQGNAPQGSALPAAIYLGGIFVASSLMTALIRGGTVFPAAVLSLAAAAASCLLTGVTPLTPGGVLLKAALSLLAGVAGFSLTKLYYLLLRPPRLKRERRDLSDLALNEPVGKKNA